MAGKVLADRRAKVFAGVACIIFLIYLANQVVSVASRKMKTEQVVEDNFFDFVRTEGTVFRDEVLIPSTATGVVVYNFSDGEAVASTSTIAEVFDTQEEAQSRNELEALQSELESLRRIEEAGSGSVTSVNPLSTQINEEAGRIADLAATGVVENIDEEKEALAESLNKKKVALGEESTFAQRISALENQLEYLQQAGTATGQKVRTPAQGYFYKKIDGYERILTFDALKEIDYDSYQQLMLQQPLSQQEISALSKHYLGKIVKNHIWYLAVDLEMEEAEKFEEGDHVKLDFYFPNGQTVQATVDEILPSGDKQHAVVIFECRDITDRLLNVRKQPVEVLFNDYSGLKVSSKALYYEQNVPGVYVLDKTTIRFKPVEIIKESGSFLLCEPKQAVDDEHTLSLLDSVIVDSGGMELRDGKRLDETTVEGVQNADVIG